MSRSNLRIKVGSYVGNATAHREIDIGFMPSTVIIRGGATTSVWKHPAQSMFATLFFNTTPGTNHIYSMTENGFTLATGGSGNANGITYHYLAIQCTNKDFMTFGRYVGDGVDDRVFTDTQNIPFTPQNVLIKAGLGSAVAYQFRDMAGDNSGRGGSVESTNIVQEMIANGWELGTSAAVNAVDDYYYWAFKDIPGIIKTGSYTGNGTSLEITDVGFRPDFIFAHSSASVSTVLKFSTETDPESFPYNAIASVSDGITSITDTGFTIGAYVGVNTDAVAGRYLCFKAGDWNVPVTRTTSS